MILNLTHLKFLMKWQNLVSQASKVMIAFCVGQICEREVHWELRGERHEHFFTITIIIYLT